MCIYYFFKETIAYEKKKPEKLHFFINKITYFSYIVFKIFIEI